jgi:hypothetical protein
MESGTPGVKSTRDGWLNRYLQASAADPSPLRGVAVARQMPRAMQGKAPSLTFGNVDTFDVRGGMDSRQNFERAFSEADNPLLRGTAKDAFEAMRTLRTIGTPYRPSAEYPRSPFAWPRPISASKSPSPNRTTGITTRTRAARRDRSRSGSTTCPAASPRLPPISANACPTL